MAKSNFKLDTNAIMNKVKEIAQDHVETLSVDAKCPHCDAAVVVQSGMNVCPHCLNKIDVDFNVNFDS